MLVSEHRFDVSLEAADDTLAALASIVDKQVPAGFVPLRFAVTSNLDDIYRCELAGVSGLNGKSQMDTIFRFSPRLGENTELFTAMIVVPTGVGAEIGGHAGDAAPVVRMIGAVCDRVLTHPNVVNASDINEMPENSFYVEGSVLCRLLMGTIGLEPVRSNRVLVVIDAHEDEFFQNAAINAVSAARASYGLQSAGVVCLDPPVKLRARFASSGRAAGRIEELTALCEVLQERRCDYDAVAISSVIDVPYEYHTTYFEAKGEMVNPWGGVEAMLTHTLSALYDVPTAHSPMLESREIANMDPGVVDCRMAAEAVSTTFLQCTLKGLQRSPRIVTSRDALSRSNVVTASDVSCLVIPDNCLGLPTLAALEQGIPVIAVRENKNLMKNDLSKLPWRQGQFHRVENYWEAVGVIAAMRAGISPASVRRPLQETGVIKTSRKMGKAAHADQKA